MHRIRKTLATLVTTLTVGGTCFQFGGCNIFGLASAAISSINPCGTIVACDARQYEFLTSGIDGPGVRPDIDPFCTYAPFCTTIQDPLFGGLTGAGP